MLITPEEITSLEEHHRFVFGSNKSGIHAGGAAFQAHKDFGAEWRNPKGIQGQSYAIPTKNETITKSLGLNEISRYVDEFIEFAKNNPQLTFFVTKIGCGLAGLKIEQIAPMFAEASDLDNVALPLEFRQNLLNTKKFSKNLF